MNSKIFVLVYCFILFIPSRISFATDGRTYQYHWNKHPLRIDLPVIWEITRSDFSDTGVVPQSESFSETWIFDVGLGIEFYLISPRAKVKVSAVSYGGLDYSLPVIIAMSEEDLAKLLGLKSAREITPRALSDTTAPIFLKLFNTPKKSEDFTLHFSNEQYYSINMMIGR